MTDKELVDQLKKSRAIVGEHSPVVVDFDGEVLSGRHRQEASWEKTENIDSRVIAEKLSVPIIVAKEVIRTHFNLQRKPSREETQESLLKIAKELETKGIPKEAIATEVVKLVPYTERWVLELLPQEYKQIKKVEAGMKGAEVLQQKPLVECDRCHMGTRIAIEREGQNFCPSCLEEIQRKPVKPPQELAPQVEAKTYKPKESWEHRKAQMHVPVSHMEERLALRLTEAGVQFESQKEYCIAKCIPDFVIAGKAFFIDGEDVHAKREEKDDLARTRLAQFHEIEPIGLTYKADTEQEEERLFRQIMDKIS